MADDRKFLTHIQRAALTKLWMAHPQGAVLRAVTARALERKGLVWAAEPMGSGKAYLSLAGVEWCEGQGW